MDADLPLVRAAADGDRDAFDELVRRHQLRVYNLVRALTGDPADADELAQETFVRAYLAMRRFRGESAFRTWLYRIAVNVVRSHHARRAVRAAVWQQAEETRDDSAPAAACGAESFETTLARREAIDRALGSLPEDLRIAVTLRDVEGLDYREIAVVTSVPIGTVESRLHRARLKLRTALAPLMGLAGVRPEQRMKR